MNVYPFIEAEKQHESGNVKRACELLQVSRSAYYQHRKNIPSQRARDDEDLAVEIAASHKRSGNSYGSPRVHDDLTRAGYRIGRKRVARIMKDLKLRGTRPKRWRTTTVPDPEATLPEDLIARDFRCDPTQIDTRWCGDITYIHTWEGWLYLATVIDIASRKVVGWATADHLRTDLVEKALDNAIKQRKPGPGVIFHSDRGCQYTSQQLATYAEAHRVRLSVGRKGQCWDNAVAESFFGTIKTECLDRRAWPTRTQAHKAIFNYIEGWYNTRRRHSSLNGHSPAEYEALTAPPQLRAVA